ncbi:hypothetical protein TRFO_41299 [Tritrichomonas foetus]|uniref:Uncharacterized protein n=1 Tax=Tritrichomonas foetus TaxID=1144522 RepID=A0A1J4L0N7_9EUKA|nr:hypothetical protein TRFO_41299 [Tritrichomonas foetus]|eukprot:OHT17089.1 hypothetical protein TRFO_41299 [Tritrichomonas foetus]
MYDEGRMARIKELMAKHKKPKSYIPSYHGVIDTRPASGMVGQNCDGYIQDQSGKLVRIANDVTTSDWVGPGSYDPIIPSNAKKIRISSNSNRLKVKLFNKTPAPGKYTPVYKDTRIHHSLSGSDPMPLPDPPMGGNMEHPSWLPKEPVKISQALQMMHPNTTFKTELSSHQFSSNSNREIFSTKFISPSPVIHSKQKSLVEFDDSVPSPAFVDKVDRFKPLQTYGPAPTTYTLPEIFGDAPGKRIMMPIEVKRKPENPTPDATTYATEIIQKVKTDHKSPQFLSKKDRFDSSFNSNPSPDAYTIRRNTAALAPKHTIRIRTSLPSQSWDYTPAREAPGVGQYSPLFSSDTTRPRMGYISQIGRRTYERKEDRPLAFRTTHSSLLQKSFNARYTGLMPNF